MKRRDFVKLAPAFPVAAVSASLLLRDDGKDPVELGVSVLKIERGDTLVLSMDRPLSKETEHLITQYMEHVIPGVKAVVLTDGLKLDGILRGPVA